MIDIRIDEQIQRLLRPLSDSELDALTANILADGRIRDPLVVWDETGILVDGHHRLAIAEEHDVPYDVFRRSFAGLDEVREWVSSNQAGRRNWDKEERNAWMRERRADGWTYQQIADAAGVSYGTVYGAAADVELINFDKLPGKDGKDRPATYAPRQMEATAQQERTAQAMAATVFSHDSLEYYTPGWITDAARAVMGGIDLDPASCEAANRWIGATRYYSADDNGLVLPWRGRVWLNPPYSFTDGKSNQDIWSQRLADEYRNGAVECGLLLVKAALGYKWFERLWDDWPVCFLRERVSFVMPNGNDDGQSKQGTAIFYLGQEVEAFIKVFASMGRVLLPEDQWRG